MACTIKTTLVTIKSGSLYYESCLREIKTFSAVIETVIAAGSRK